MAVPRIFISSTCYDLKEHRFIIKEDLENIGYEVVLSEKGDIPYVDKSGLEKSCYMEVSQCDILVGIIGGRFGSESEIKQEGADRSLSITMSEIKYALSNKKLVFIFVDNNVDSEYKTYSINKDNCNGIRWAHVDDVRIFEFLRTLYEMKIVPIIPFSLSSDIVGILKKQLAGALGRFIQDDARASQENTARNIDKSVNSLENSIKTLDDVVSEIDFRINGRSHFTMIPILCLRNLLGIKDYTVLTNSKQGLVAFILDMGFHLNEKLSTSEIVFTKDNDENRITLTLSPRIFIDEMINPKISIEDCHELITLKTEPIPLTEKYEDEDIPF